MFLIRNTFFRKTVRPLVQIRLLREFFAAHVKICWPGPFEDPRMGAKNLHIGVC